MTYAGFAPTVYREIDSLYKRSFADITKPENGEEYWFLKDIDRHALWEELSFYMSTIPLQDDKLLFANWCMLKFDILDLRELDLYPVIEKLFTDWLSFHLHMPEYQKMETEDLKVPYELLLGSPHLRIHLKRFLSKSGLNAPWAEHTRSLFMMWMETQLIWRMRN